MVLFLGWLFVIPLHFLPLVPVGDLPEDTDREEVFSIQLEQTQPTRKALLASYRDDLPYNKVCWLTSHNAFATKEDNWLYEQQSLNIQDQFRYGVRSFMIDLYWFKRPASPAYIALCHEDNSGFESSASNVLNHMKEQPEVDCFWTRQALGDDGDPRPALEFLKIIRKLLDENPSEIITIHIESYLHRYQIPKEIIVDYITSHLEFEGRSNRIRVGSYLLALLQEARLMDYLYGVSSARNISSQNILTPHAPDYWPTLGQLRNTLKKRLIVFSDRESDGVLSTGSYLETEYNLYTSPHCEMRKDRRALPKNLPSSGDFSEEVADIKPSKPLLVLNHFYTFPMDVFKNYEVVNHLNLILKRASTCLREQRLLPNFIAVDLVEQGDGGGPLRASLLVNQLLAETMFQGTLHDSHETDSLLRVIDEMGNSFCEGDHD